MTDLYFIDSFFRLFDDANKVVKKHGEIWGNYGLKSEEQLRRGMKTGGVVVFYKDETPSGILRSIRIHTGHDLGMIPTTYDKLTGNGDWTTHDPDGNTIVLVDFCRFLGVDWRDASRYIINHAKGHLFPLAPYALTYSPDIARVISIHEKNGARFSGQKPKKAREGYISPIATEGDTPEDAALMIYRW